MQAKIQKINFEENCRILVTSDIHANLNRFQKLLIEMNYRPGVDYLIINGDLIEKGPQNLETVQYIKNLAETTMKVYVTLGNCDELIHAVFNDEDLYNYFKQKPDSLVCSWLNAVGVDITTRYFSPHEIKELLNKHYSDEVKWITSFPIALESDEHIFVHAGLPKTTTELSTKDYEAMLSLRNFYHEGHGMNKIVVVGHYPVRNYHIKDSYDSSVIIDMNKRIISIDGGNQLDADGQLNGLIITKHKNNYHYETTFVDDFSFKRIIKDFIIPKQTLYNVVWPYNRINILEKGEDFSWCKVLELDEVERVLLKNEYLETNAPQPYILKYHSAELLSVNKGEQVKIVDDTCSGFTYIKRAGIVGWIPKDITR